VIKFFGKRLFAILSTVASALFNRQLYLVNRKTTDGELFDYNILSAYWNQEPPVAAYRAALEKSDMVWSDNLSKRGRFYSLYQMASLVLDRDLGEGDVAECGCWKGHSTYMVATVLREKGFGGKFCIFDSFEGLSEFNEADRNQRFDLNQQQITVQRDLFASPEDLVKATLAEFDFMEYYRGWIPERFPEVADRRFILVNIDLVLYEPTRDALSFFLPRLAQGGIICFNDYGLNQFPGPTAAIDDAVAAIDASLFYKLPTGGAFLIK
jgi:O-methyltransferase